MAAVMSAKRPRAFTSSVDLGGSGKNGRNKRPRTSIPNGSEASSADDQSYASSDSEASDDGGERVQEHEQMAWATQQVQKDFQATANKQNTATDSGIIEEIHCINFMCHEHLTVTLGPLINFIIGHNGSGKSAVLTALTICLGGKATATNRAQNLKSLIKEGKDHSSVMVRIKNQGPLAYKPSQYGKSISVERHFNKSGTSGFKLKDQNGKIISTKKAELEDILDAFSMQIDNPMNVLTQDMARQFLNHSTPKDKYKFFLQGTQLENLNRDYQQIEQSLELMNTKAEVKEADLGVLRERMEEIGKKAKRAQHLEKMRAKETEIAHQVAWANVQEEEKLFADANHELERVDDLIKKRAAAVDETSATFERADQAYESARQSVTDITTDIEPAKQAVMEASAKFADVKAKLFSLKADGRKAGSDVTLKTNRVNKHKTDIEQHRQRQAAADNGLYAVKVQEVSIAKEESVRAEKAYMSHDDGLPHIKEQLKMAQSEKQAADQNVDKQRSEQRRIQGNIKTLQGGQRDWMESYQNPAKLQNLLRAIESHSGFREKPVGPLGRHVKLVRPEWAHILEKQFGPALNGFVVTSKADQTILSKLMITCQWVSPIFIGNRNPIDTTRNEPEDPNLLTWMKALKIEDHLVRNQFIINQSIEQTVLIESRDEGSKFMHARGPMTRNVRMCFAFADGNQRKGRVINYTSNGGINDSPIDEYRFSLRMQVDREAQIRGEQTRLEQIQRELYELEKTSSELHSQVNTWKAREQDHNAGKKRLKLAHQKIQDTVERLETELSEATPDAAAIEVLEELLGVAQEELKRAEGIFEDLVLQEDQLGAENRVNKNNLTEAQKLVQEFEFKLEKAQSTVRRLQDHREDALKAKNKAIAQVAVVDENKSVWETARDEAQQSIDAAIEAAKKVCPERVPVPADKTSDQLAELLQRLVATRRAAEKVLGGSQDELLRQANESKRTHKNAMQEFEEIKNLRNHLINTLTNRRNRWKQFRSGISVRARVTFNYLLSERKFRGTLSIDHNKSLLDIHVQPDIMERSGDGRQTKTLSGGEKSYSTVCLLLSLWDAMGSPIRCLDEFDVFMDSVNRERSMHMIIQAARRSIGRQFIFITPQSMNNVTQTSDVKIIKMNDPERGQTALNMHRS